MSEKRSQNVYAMFAIVVLTCALGSFTQTVMNSMLGGVAQSFGTEDSVSQWLTTAYMLTIGITVPIVTHLSRKMSIRTLTLLALWTFLAGAFIDWFAPDFLILLLGRIPQAVASGIMLPLITTIAMTRFPPGQNGTAMGVAGIAMGFAPNIGPLIGGVLVDSFGWRSFFIILTLVLSALIVCAMAFINREDVPARDAHLDILSFMLSILGFGGLLLGFTNAASMPLLGAAVWLPIVVGAVCLAWFVLRQNKVEHPLISMHIFQSADYRISFIMQNCLFASFMGITLIVPLFVQNVQGLSALDAGLVFVPATIFAIVVNPVSGILSDKIGARPVVIAASMLLTGGAVWFCFLDASAPLWLITLAQTVRGIGVSSLIGPMISWGMRELPHDIMMDGSSFFTTVRQACASLGTALMMLVIAAVSGTATGAAAAFGYQLAFALSAALAASVFILAIWKVK